MTQEEKKMLLKDLCARLLYGVMLNTPNGNKSLLALIFSKKYNTIVEYDDYHGNENDISEWEGGDVEFIKPYLRPMSSMTEEEQKEFVKFHCVNICPIVLTDMLTLGNESKMFDWLNAHHFDYRGLIERCLALEAPEGMYDTKN